MKLRAVIVLALAGCRMAAGPTFSAGSVAVPGTATGFGAGIDLEVRHPSGLAGAVTADMAGYSGAGDGDPIFWSEAQLRYRIPLSESTRDHVFTTLGVGIGYAWCCYVDDVVAGGFAEIAYERSIGRMRIGAALRERPAYFMGGGDPFGEFHNTLHLALTIGVDIGGREPGGSPR